MFAILFSLEMARCQTKNYEEKLESLYSHTVELINSTELAGTMTDNENLVILDIRSREEYSVSHIKGAHFIDYDGFKKKHVENIPKDASVVVYCSVGYRSEKVGEKLVKLGFSDVKNLYGGIFQWKNENHPVYNAQSFATDSVHTYNRQWSKWLLNGIKVY